MFRTALGEKCQLLWPLYTSWANILYGSYFSFVKFLLSMGRVHRWASGDFAPPEIVCNMFWGYIYCGASSFHQILTSLCDTATNLNHLFLSVFSIVSRGIKIIPLTLEPCWVGNILLNSSLGTSLVVQWLRNHLPIEEMWFLSLGREDPLEKGMAIHSSILVRKIPWTEEPGRLQSMGLQRVEHDWIDWTPACHK